MSIKNQKVVITTIKEWKVSFAFYVNSNEIVNHNIVNLTKCWVQILEGSNISKVSKICQDWIYIMRDRGRNWFLFAGQALYSESNERS